MMTRYSRLYRFPVLSLLCMTGVLWAHSAVHAGTVPNVTVSLQELRHDADSSSPGRQAYSRTGADLDVIESPPDPAEDTNTEMGATVLVDINSASVDALAAALPGIGPGKAQRIVDWREANGPFQSIDQLLEVSGIGPVTLENIRPFVRLGDVVSMSRDRHRHSTQEQAVILAMAKIIRRVVSDRAEVLRVEEGRP